MNFAFQKSQLFITISHLVTFITEVFYGHYIYKAKNS